jgi:hypothetical protein
LCGGVGPPGKSIRPIAVYLETFRTYARRAPRLLLVGVVVFVPLGLLEAVVGRFDTIEGANDNGLTIAAELAVLLVQVVVSLLGEVFYSGAVANLLAAGDEAPSLGQVAARLAYGRLVAVAVIFDLAVAAGLLLLVVPGVVVFTWFALAAPLIELEGCGVREALRRSRQLVRGRFWPVLAVLGPLTLASDSLDDSILAGVHHLLGGGLAAEWLSASLSGILLSPLYAVPAVLITLHLIGHARLAAFDRD